MGPAEERLETQSHGFHDFSLAVLKDKPQAQRAKLGLRECDPVSACLGVYSDVGLELNCQFWLATSAGASACCFWLFGDSGVVVLVLASRVQRQSRVM